MKRALSIILSTRGTNDDDVPKELSTFLKYVHANLSDSERDYHDPYVAQLQKTVHEIKSSREMEDRFMILEEMLQKERNKGREEGRVEGRVEKEIEDNKEFVLEILDTLGEIPEETRTMIQKEADLEKLKSWRKRAIKSTSLKEFLASF